MPPKTEIRGVFSGALKEITEKPEAEQKVLELPLEERKETSEATIVDTEQDAEIVLEAAEEILKLEDKMEQAESVAVEEKADGLKEVKEEKSEE